MIHRPGYKAGDTLRLILPFLKAYGANDESIQRFSSQNLLLVPYAAEMLKNARDVMPVFIISTSYRPYIAALCDAIDFPRENTCCTELQLDKCRQTSSDGARLKTLASAVNKMPLLEWSDGATGPECLSEENRLIVTMLDEIIWKDVGNMGSGQMLQWVNPVGGVEKANAIREIVKKENASLAGVIYFGDSITDVEAFRLVRENGGVAVSFNGNGYAIREAEIAVLSPDARMIGFIANVFRQLGKDDTLIMARNWPTDQENKKVVLLTEDNREEWAEKSAAFRKTVRGEQIAQLG